MSRVLTSRGRSTRGASRSISRQGLTRLEMSAGELYGLQAGTAVKCNLCVERIDEGMRGPKPGHRP